MGFFSSRKSDGDFILHDRSGNKTTTAVVKVIRSRFYGKQKGTDPSRAEPDSSSGTFIPQDASTASTLAAPVQSLRKTQSTPFSSTIRKVSSSKLKNFTSASNSLRATTPEPSVRRNSVEVDSQSKSVFVSTASASISQGTGTSTTRSATKTDTVTMTLAQRLNELAVANEQGLLNDDEYRLLRQNLFERFAGNAIVPTENSVVPASVTPLGHPQRGVMTMSEGRSSFSSSRLSSNFNIDITPNLAQSPRSPSIRSVRSGVASILHRAANRGSNRERGDTLSIYSVTSTTSNALASTQNHRSPGSVRKKTSNSSIGADAATDTVSLSSRTSRKTGLGYAHPDRSPSDGYTPHTPSRSTTSSIRRLAVPPSSFSAKGLDPTRKYTGGGETADDPNLVTSADIKREMAAVEAEGRRLMDAFNGLEVTMLAKKRRGGPRHDIRPTTIVGLSPASSLGDHIATSGSGTTWTLAPDAKMPFRSNLQLDTDVISIRSGTSAYTSHTSHTSRSTPRSVHRDGGGGGGIRKLPPLPNPSPGSVSGSGGSLRRKNSSSSMGSSSINASRKRGLSSSTPAASVPPIPIPVPALPPNLGHLGHASNSSLNLTRSTGHLPMSSVPEDDMVNLDEFGMGMGGGVGEVDEEMDEIRKRREDVSRRYEERLEYLRAKLKGAQLHEKLMKK